MHEVELPPRKGGVGIDVLRIAVIQAQRLGVMDWVLDTLCTSCHGVDPKDLAQPNGFGTWFSNVRENPSDVKQRGYGMRNAWVVMGA